MKRFVVRHARDGHPSARGDGRTRYCLKWRTLGFVRLALIKDSGLNARRWNPVRIRSGAACSLLQSTEDAHIWLPMGGYRTPMGGRGPKLLLELWAEGSESRGAERLLSPLPALALAEPVRLRF